MTSMRPTTTITNHERVAMKTSRGVVSAFVYNLGVPEPGKGPFVSLKGCSKGTPLLGMAPMGVRWRGKVGATHNAIPERGCPRSEFVPTHALIAGVWLELKEPTDAVSNH
jgi:hypothetical protein